MKREIVFRGKTAKGQWVYGQLIKVGFGTAIYIPKDLVISSELDENVAMQILRDEIFAVEPESVGQFTGLKDKLGNDIYENDVCLYQISVKGELIEHKIRIDYANGGFIATALFDNDRGLTCCELWRYASNLEVLKED